MIYLDNAATTPLDPRVFEEMIPFFTSLYGNPGSIHSMGVSVKHAVDTARERVASLICARPEEIVFTSGGTESNNLAIIGLAEYMDFCVPGCDKYIAVSNIEHESVRCAAAKIATLSGLNLAYRGISLVPIKVSKDGIIKTESIEEIIDVGTGLVSVMCVNNETGSINDIAAIGNMCKSRGVFFHTDCVQAAPFMDLDVRKIECDLMSLSSHKLHGPKGVGALYVQSSVPIYSQICGSPTQEFGVRGGTLNVPGIVGFGKACELAEQELQQRRAYTLFHKRRFFEVLRSKLGQYGMEHIMHVNGNPPGAPGGILNLRFDGVDGETLLLYLNAREIYVSSGSACHAQEQKPSEVLKAMGLTDEQAHQSIRFSFSCDKLMPEEADKAAEIVAESIKDLVK